MKPADHPDFFRRPAPAGRSRESAIVLDRQGRFWHEGAPVEHQGLARALARWLDRHPDDGRFILSNGYDWCYLTVEDTACFVTALRIEGDDVELELFDGTREPLDPTTARLDLDDVLRVRVKAGQVEARFTRRAQLQLAAVLDADEPPALRIGGRRYEIGRS